MTAGEVVVASLPSDAPLLTQHVRGDRGEGLRRILDEPWRTDIPARDLFRREIEAAIRISSSSSRLFPRLLEARDGAEPTLLREYSVVGTLEDRVLQGPALDSGEIATVIAAVLEGLDELERLGLWHGDPSPSNVLLMETGAVVLADPMSSRRCFAESPLAPSDERRRERFRLTRWLLTLLQARSFSAADALGRELYLPLADSTAKDQALLRLRQVVDQLESSRLPVRPPALGSEAFQSQLVAPVEVLFRCEPLSDHRARYRIAKVLADSSGRSAAQVRTELESRAVLFETLYPEPSRTLAGAVQQEGGTVRILSRALKTRSGAEPLPAGDSSVPVSPRPRGSFIPIFAIPSLWRGVRRHLSALFETEGEAALLEEARGALTLSLLLTAHLVFLHALLLTTLALLASIRT